MFCYIINNNNIPWKSHYSFTNDGLLSQSSFEIIIVALPKSSFIKLEIYVISEILETGLLLCFLCLFPNMNEYEYESIYH